MVIDEMSVISGRRTALVENPVDLGRSFTTSLPPSLESLSYHFSTINRDTDSALFRTLRIVYQAFVSECTPDQRLVFLTHTIERVESVVQDPAALKVFIQFEPDQQIVCLAVWAYLQHRKARFDNPFVAAGEIAGIFVDGDPVNRGAVFAALVCFGDRRVCALARTIKGNITAADARSFALAVSTPLNRVTLEFCLTWLLELVRRKDFEIAIPVSSALSAMIVKDASLMIHHDQYNFGPYAFPSATNYPSVRLGEFLVELSPILDALAELDKPALNQMIAIFRNPGSVTLDQLERRKLSTRRRSTDRRASDRRIVDIVPHIERRSQQRRNEERRMMNRR